MKFRHEGHRITMNTQPAEPTITVDVNMEHIHAIDEAGGMPGEAIAKALRAVADHAARDISVVPYPQSDDWIDESYEIFDRTGEKHLADIHITNR